MSIKPAGDRLNSGYKHSKDRGVRSLFGSTVRGHLGLVRF